MSATSQPVNYGKLWTRDELILAFELYCRIPFQKTKANNSEVVKLAKLLHRSPASVARKLGNLGSFDPELKRRNISGLTHGSKLDEQVWNEFHDNWNELVLEAHELCQTLQESRPTEDDDINRPKGPSERLRLRKERIHQSFFRETIISSYDARCCVTGIPITECLIAYHIIPWRANEDLRTDPTNGLCLSATFERLFDNGLMTVSADLNVILASQLLKHRSGPIAQQIGGYQEKPILRPHRFLPSLDCLKWHRQNVFQN